jgi:integrase
VPDHLQAAVPKVLGTAKPQQTFIKKSLGTKDRREANHRATHALADIARVLQKAAAIAERPKAASVARTQLNDTEIKRMADYVYAKALAWDERIRVGGRDELKRMEAEHVRLEGRPLDGPWAFPYETLPPHGLSMAQLADSREQLDEDLRFMREALALGDVSVVQHHVEDALSEFDIRLERDSLSFPKLGIEVLRAYVRALQAIEKRNAGEPVETPKFTNGFLSSLSASGGTLRDAIAGWEKERVRPAATIHEYRRAVDMFIQLHGDLPVAQIKKSHAREFREALQAVPSFRAGHLRNAALPELSAWGRKHPAVPKVSAGTVNKQLGAVQAIAGWAHHNGVIPDDVPWADPFHKMRVEEEQSRRGPFDARELQEVFSAPLFTANEEPEGAKGAAGVWLPLLALFTGARRGEIAAFKVENVRKDEATHTPMLFIVADRKVGKRVKTKTSERVVPVHPQLVKLGFLKYVEGRARDGEQAWLFPAVAPDQGRALSAWGKWWSRYLRQTVGIIDAARVFHSFRHGFQDALRRATADEELRDALAGRSNRNSVSRTYGAKNMLERWGCFLDPAYDSHPARYR